MNLFKKIIVLSVIVLLIFGLSGDIFINKTFALTPGEAVGKAAGAGAACFLSAKIESFVAGMVSRWLPDTQAEVASEVGASAVTFSVPVNTTNISKAAKSVETSNALMKSKDCIRDVIAKVMLDWVVDETVKWIQGGGEPAFVGNWENFSQDAFNVGVGEAVNATILAPICSPFKLQVRLSLLPVERYTQRITCTLDDIVENIEDFYADFSKGGWLAYNEAWQPQNNYFGLMLMYQDEALENAIKKEEAARNEALAGNGFLSVKRCVEYEPNSQLSALNQSCVNVGATGDALSRCLEAAKKSAPPSKCLKEEIITPGDTVGEAAATAITSDTVWAANIKSWTASIVNAAINRLIQEGLATMKSSAEPRSSGYGNLDPYYGTDPNLQAKRDYINNVISNYGNIRDRINAASSVKNQSLSYVSQQRGVLEQLRLVQTATSSQPLPPACSPLVADAAIQNLQTEIDRLTSETNNLQNSINEINNNVAEAKNISADYREREFTLITNKYDEFSTNNQSLIAGLLSGAAKTAADSEATTKQNDLTVSQNRLTICQAAIP